MMGMAIRHNFERDRPKDHPCQVWFNLVQRFQRRRFKCDLLSKYAIPTSNQDGRQAKNRKMGGDEILIVHCCFSISQNELKF
jgi:hypothetical protein